VKRLLDWASEAAQWILLIGFAIFWVLVVPELDARFGPWWFIPGDRGHRVLGQLSQGVNCII